MPRFRLQVVSEPDEDDPRPVFVKRSSGPESRNAEPERMALTCGQCDAVLITNINPDLLANVLLKCPHCGSVNEAGRHVH